MPARNTPLYLGRRDRVPGVWGWGCWVRSMQSWLCLGNNPWQSSSWGRKWNLADSDTDQVTYTIKHWSQGTNQQSKPPLVLSSWKELQQPQMHWLLQCGQPTQHTTADQRRGKDVDTVWDPTTSVAIRYFSFINPSNPQKTLSWALSLFHRENEDLSVFQ